MWDWLDRIKDSLTLGGMVLGICVVVYWWWLNRSKSGWVWGVFFWPSACNKNLVNCPDGLPIVISVRCQIVNVSIFPKFITEVLLTLEKDGIVHEFYPYAMMGPDCFVKADSGWTNDKKELFRPFTVEPMKDSFCHLLFIPVGSKDTHLRKLSAGEYEGKLVYKRAVGQSIKVFFPLRITDDNVKEFAERQNPFGKLARDLKVKKAI